MNRRSVWIGVSVLIGWLGGCTPKEPEPLLRNGVAINDKLWGAYEVLNMDGQPQNTFKTGENFQLSFVLRNVSDDTLNTSLIGPLQQQRLSWIFLLENRQFFEVLRVNTSGAYLSMGKPIDNIPPDAVIAITPGGIILPPKTTLTYRVHWQTQLGQQYEIPIYGPLQNLVPRRYFVRTVNNRKVEILSAGQYYAGFTLNIFNENVLFSLKFTVQ